LGSTNPLTAETGHSPRPGPSRRTRGPVAYVIIGIVVATAAIGWAIVIANWSGSPGVAAQVIAFRVTGDDAVELTYEVAKPKGSVVRCSLVALDVDHAEVARTTTLIPAGTGHVERTQRLPTSARATAADIRECRTE
jgi:hypothetical protein